MALCAFLKTNPWFNACFKFLIYTTYSVLSCKLAASFSTFSIFILLRKKDKNHCEGYLNVLIIEHQLKKISFITFITIAFYEILIKVRNIFNPFKVIYIQLSRYCPYI